MNGPPTPLSRSRFDAILFDLDGVLTETAVIHAACWKRLFDDYLEQRARTSGGTFVPFDRRTDYLAHVDGKTREDGVRDFLASRGIELPEGHADDAPGLETVWGLAARKDGLFDAVLASDGVTVYPDAIPFVRSVRAAGMRTGVVSSSRNCRAVLEAAGIAGLFDTRVDGQVAADRGLPGKPAPDMFLAAAEELSAAPARTVVLEDAIAGVRAACAGGFGLVVGVARHGEPAALSDSGADLVLEDMTALWVVTAS